MVAGHRFGLKAICERPGTPSVTTRDQKREPQSRTSLPALTYSSGQLFWFQTRQALLELGAKDLGLLMKSGILNSHSSRDGEGFRTPQMLRGKRLRVQYRRAREIQAPDSTLRLVVESKARKHATLRARLASSRFRFNKTSRALGALATYR
jgi:hypothetical protein